MKSNYCNDCLIQTDCEYIKVDTMCEKAAAFEAGRRDREKELPKNAVIINSIMYSFKDVTDKSCDHCQLHEKCWAICKLDLPICAIFGSDTSNNRCFKKE